MWLIANIQLYPEYHFLLCISVYCMLSCAHCDGCTGRIRLRKDPENEAPINLLAPDPLTDPPTVETLTAALKRISAPVKVLYSMHCASTVITDTACEICAIMCVARCYRWCAATCCVMRYMSELCHQHCVWECTHGYYTSMKCDLNNLALLHRLMWMQWCSTSIGNIRLCYWIRTGLYVVLVIG
jgi:hypothetical protein